MNPSLTYAFDPYEIRAGQLFLEGAPLDLEPRVFQLIELLAHADGVVPVAELKQALWSSNPPADSALHNLVSKARKALAQCGGNPITAIRGEGYRLGVTVEQRRPTGERFVGRSRELADLSGMVCAPQEHSGLRLIVITGAPGSGKTTLVRELARRSRAKGIRCAFARCFDGSEAPPFWPWQELWSELFPEHGDLSDDVLADENSPHGEGTVVGGAQRRRLALRLLSQLKTSSRQTPLLLIFDDVHLAGEETLEILTFLCTATSLGPVSVVATRRPASLSKARQALDRLERHAQLVELAPLGPRSSLELVRLSCPSALSPEDEQRLLELADGNPLFLKELARIAPSGSADRLPRLVSSAIDDHLRALPPETLHGLQSAALIGERFDLRLLAQCLKASAAGVAEALGPAVESGVVRLLSLRDAEFAHALYQQRLQATQDPAAKRRTHHTLARALQGETAMSPEHLGAIARHLTLAAESPEDWARACAAGQAAGESYASQFAYETATEHFENALASGAHCELSIDDRIRVELRLSECLVNCARSDRAREAHARALQLATQTQSAVSLGKCLVAEYWLDTDPLKQGTPLLQKVGDVLRDLPETELALRAQVHAVRAEGTLFEPDQGLRDRDARAAVELAERSGDLSAISRARYADAMSRWGDMGRHREWLNVVQRTEDAARRAHDDRLIVRTGILRVVALLERGQIAEAELLAMETKQYASDLSLAFEILCHHVREAGLSMFRGEPTARRQILELGRLGADIAPHFAQHTQSGQEIIAAFEFADAPVMDAWMESIADLSLNDASLLVTRAFFLQTFRRQRRDVYELAHERTCDGLPLNNIQLTLSCFLAELHAWFGEHDRARASYELLLPFQGYLCITGIGAAFPGPVSYALGRVAHFLGKASDARQHFDDARDLCERLRSRPWVQRCDTARGRLASPYNARGGIRPMGKGQA